MQRERLPIDEHLPEIMRLLSAHGALVLTAAPGAGKSTRVPAFLAGALQQKVLVTQPRRIAAVSLAHRVAQECNQRLGDEVGYAVRGDHKQRATTRLLYLSDGLLLKQMASDPNLGDVGAVILDEFHERSLTLDFLLYLLRDLRIERPDLKILVMSATLNATKLGQYLEAPVLDCPGRLFEIDDHFSQQPHKPADLEDAIRRVIHQHAPVTSKSILVFCATRRECSMRADALSHWAQTHDYQCFELHGGLDLDRQRAVLDPRVERKIIFATNVAETSITVPHVNCVIDTGLERRPHYDSDLDLSSLLTARITRFSSVQRRGRAGRTSTGQYIRLWTKNEDLHLEPEPLSEIQNCDLVSGLVQLKSVSDVNPLKAEFFEAPPTKRLTNAVEKLKSLKLIDAASFQLSSLARRASRHPFDIRFGLCIEEAENKEQQAKLVALALLAERAPASSSKDAVFALTDALKNSMFRRDLSTELSRLGLDLHHVALDQHLVSKSTRLLLIKNFSERVAVQTPSGDRVLASGRRIVGANEACFFLLSGQDKGQSVQADLFLTLDPSDLRAPELKDLVSNRPQMTFDPTSNKLSKSVVKSFVNAPLGQALPVAIDLGDAHKYFLDHKAEVIQAIKKSAPWQTALSRLALAQELSPTLIDGDIESLAFSAIVNHVESEGLTELPLQQAPNETLAYALDSRVLAEIDRELPRKLLIPSGRELELAYSVHQKSIVLSVRIQEIFGWTQSPHLGWRQIQLQFELLSPGYKPVQKTSDLKSFWSNSYPDLRKELMRQYPRHSWPEDPHTAQAVAKGRSHKR